MKIKLNLVLPYILSFFPFLGILSLGVLGLAPIDVIFVIGILPFGIIHIFYKQKVLIDIRNSFLLLWIIYLIIWSFYNYLYINESFQYGRISRQIAIFIVFTAIYSTSFYKKTLDKLFIIFKITILLSLLVSIIQVFNPSFMDMVGYYQSGGFQNKYENIYEYRRTSLFGYIGRNAFSLSFIPLMALYIGYAMYKKDRNIILFVTAGAIVAFLSNSRHIMIGYLLVSSQLYLIEGSFKKKIKYTVYFLISAIITVVTLVFIVNYDLQAFFENRLLAEGSIQETTRFGALFTFMEFFPDHFIFGNGDIYHPEVVYASNLIGSSHIHVGYLSHLVAYGIVGCSFLFGFWFFLVKDLIKTAKETGYWGSVFAYLAFFWSFATFSQSSILYYSLILALVFDKYFKDKINNK